MSTRKGPFGNFDWLLDQVRALLSGLIQNTIIDGVAVSRTVEETLINCHCTYLNFFSSPQTIHVIALYRREMANNLYLSPLGWEDEIKDAIFNGNPVRYASGIQSIRIEANLLEFNVMALCRSSVPAARSFYFDAVCGFLVFEIFGFLSH